MMTDAQIIAKYGQPGDPDNITTLVLPYKMRIAWDTSKTVTKIQCHKLIKDRLEKVFNDLLAHYGYDKIKELGIDLFGGCLNVRLKRGSKNKWGTHAWAIAIDKDPARNGLKVKWANSQFAKPEYKPMMDIFYKHGFENQGKELGFDAMHFQTAY